MQRGSLRLVDDVHRRQRRHKLHANTASTHMGTHSTAQHVATGGTASPSRYSRPALGGLDTARRRDSGQMTRSNM